MIRTSTNRKVPIYMIAVFALIVLTGIVGGISSTYSTLKNWTPLDSACYVSRGKINVALNATESP